LIFFSNGKTSFAVGVFTDWIGWFWEETPSDPIFLVLLFVYPIGLVLKSNPIQLDPEKIRFGLD